jgi:hypothetical protein
LAAFVVRSTHWPLQGVNPELHVSTHCPPAQFVTPFVTAGQACPQAPQLFLSLWRLVHAPPQRSGLVESGQTQLPLLQTWAAGHTFEQEPQFFGSLCMFVQEVPLQ